MNGGSVKISIVIPVYNVAEYLPACLHSCLEQTLFDIEIICVNDGSTDSSLDILKEFADHDYRIRIIDKANGGLSSARNAGIQVATGSMIMFLDSDDQLSPNACERVWCEVLENNADIVIFGTEIFPAKPTASKWHYHVLHVGTRLYNEADIMAALFSEPGAKPFVWRQAYARRLFDAYGVFFDETVRYGEDIVFQMEMIPYAKRIAVISDRLYHYRWYREGSLMNSYRLDMDKKIQQHISLVDKIASFWKETGWLDAQPMAFTQWILEFVVYDIGTQNVQYKKEHYEAVSDLLKRYGLYRNLHCVPAKKYGYLVRRILRKH